MKPLGQKIAVLGLGVSGFQSALFLKEKGFHVFVSDAGDSEAVRQKAGELRALGMDVETGRHSTEKILASDSVVISPGIPPSSVVYRALCEKSVPVLSEIELASRYSPTQKVIAVTGSSGKTTVSTLIARVFQKAFGRAFLCGNIGNPWIGEIGKIKPEDFVVLEVSSFQLMHCESFRPRAGVLLNLSPNHQDWHPDMNDYVQAKLRLFKNQGPEDYAVFRRADEEMFFPHFEFQAKRVYFGAADPSSNPNEDAVRAVAALFRVPAGIPEEVFRDFEGIEHRLERAAKFNGVTYINDSKSTTTASLAWALGKFPDHSVVLLAGGHPKSDDFHTVRELVNRKVRTAVLIGEARGLLRKAWPEVPAFETDNFREAVTRASQAAKPGETVLLSPACASFDMFKNYMERGDLFKKIVAEITAQAPAGSRS